MTTTTRAEHGPELATTNTPGYHIRRDTTVDRMTPATQADDVLADAHRQHTEDQP
ncbi:hypothetical protein ABNF97_09350 [Plantactinospora sp. B6F1]|uniref:hypothetical protein n=1 Tax=Plantactinospora sp. B6F1 TaxID=3158971 RepID=UPI0032D8DD04